MLATLIIVFREIMEAGLILGVVLAATRGVPHRNRWIAGGVVGGMLGACVLALFAGSVSDALDGMGQELFNVAILSLAVVMLTWHVVWMARHGRELVAQMKTVGAEVVAGKRSLFALAMVVGIAVLREGAEIVLFLYGIAVSGNETLGGMLLGGAIGLAAGAVLAALLYFGLLKIRTRYLFSTTSGLIALLAAGLASQAAFFLQQAQLVMFWDEPLWDSSWLLAGNSIGGEILRTLIGYTDQPTGLQLAAYLGTLGMIFLLTRRYGGVEPKPLTA